MTAPINAPLDWMRRALDIEEPQLVEQLQTEPGVLPVVDVVQGGWFGITTWATGSDTVPASSIAGVRLLLNPGSRDLGALIAGLHIQRLGGAGAAVVQIAFADASAGPVYVVVGQGSFAAAGPLYLSHKDLFGATAPVYLPPNWRMFIAFPATAVGETYETRFTWAAHPRGAKPL